MRTLLSPNWLLLLTAAPLLLLALLGYGEFSVIHTLLPAAAVALWQGAAGVLAGLGLATMLAAGWYWRRGRELGIRYAGATLLAYTLYLAWLTYNSQEMLPRTVPAWMVPTEPLVYAWTFLMPTLFHALLVLVLQTTPPDQPHSAGTNFALAVVVPVMAWVVVGTLGAVGGTLLHALLDTELVRWVGQVLLLLGLTVGPLTFLFFLVRGVYVTSLKRPDAELTLVWKLVISLVLPLLGLLTNTVLFLGGGGRGSETGIFGNFSSPWFYGLAVLNGVLLCLPNPAGPRGRLALLAGRSGLLGYTLYFFVVFLPLLPFSVFAVILVGVGFLMLAPLLLLVVHVRALADDVAALQGHYGRGRLRAVLLGGALLLPLFLALDYYHDRRTLHTALDYVYSPRYGGAPQALDAPALARTLAVVRRHKDRGRDLFAGTQQPYLSLFYNWLVLDNLTLSDEKIAQLQHVFIGPDPAGDPDAARLLPVNLSPLSRNPAVNQPVLRSLAARSTYDPATQTWTSWVNLTIANRDPTQVRGEYSATFALPEGCWLSGYYLDINGRREPGQLAERKAATWVYHQVVNERTSHDPGLLAYANPRQLALHVYPVVATTPRTTGFEVLHKAPLTLRLDGHAVQLGPAAAAAATSVAAASAAPARAVPLAATAPAGLPVAPILATPLVAPGGGVVYLSAAAKQRLPLVRRQPYYHFLLDASAAALPGKADVLAQVQAVQARHPLPGPARFTLVNAYAAPLPAGADWQRALRQATNAGGCYLTGAMRRTLAEAQLQPAPTYPVLVVATPDLARCVLPADFADLAAAYPESDHFFVARPDGSLEAHSLRQESVRPLPTAASTAAPDAAPDAGPAAAIAATEAAAPAAVRAWPTAARALAYVPADSTGSVVLTAPAAVLAVPSAALAAPATAPGRWETGLLLRGYGQWQALHPEAAEHERGPFIQASFRTGILTPLTAYLALENDAQRAALARKQADVLNANANLDAEEASSTATAVPLDDYAWLLVLLALPLAWRRLGRR